MPLPIIIGIGIAAAAGIAASKGTTKVREYINDGEICNVECPYCSNGGPHKFAIIDRSYAAGAGIGILAGGVGGAIGGAIAKKIFKCNLCGRAIYENGEKPGWNADKAISAFFKYKPLENAYDELQHLIARNQTITQKHTNEIIELRKELEKEKSNKKELEKKIRIIIEKMKSEGAQ